MLHSHVSPLNLCNIIRLPPAGPSQPLEQQRSSAQQVITGRWRPAFCVALLRLRHPKGPMATASVSPTLFQHWERGWERGWGLFNTGFQRSAVYPLPGRREPSCSLGRQTGVSSFPWFLPALTSPNRLLLFSQGVLFNYNQTHRESSSTKVFLPIWPCAATIIYESLLCARQSSRWENNSK